MGKYEKTGLPVSINGNAYLNGAQSYAEEKSGMEKKKFNPNIRLETDVGKLFLYITCDEAILNLENNLVTTGLLGKTVTTRQRFETTNGSPITFDKDFFGKKKEQ